MKIFVLLSRIPWPLEKGDKLRAFHQVRCLAKNHEIYLCALNADHGANQQEAFKALQPFCKSITFVPLGRWGIFQNIVKAFFSGKPLQVGYFYNRKAHLRVKQIVLNCKPDVVYGQLVRVAEYLKDLPLPKALDYQDVFSQGMARRATIARWPFNILFRLEYNRLRRYETMAFGAFDLKTIISYTDRELIPHPFNHQILVVPNGVDHDFFFPSDEPKVYDIVFTGNMAYPPNVNAAEFLVREIMPLVWAKRSETLVLIAGANPDRRVKALQNIKVTVSGWLDDIRQAYRSSKVFVAPMRIGTGLQNKLLEAMSMGLPCLTTTLAHKALGGRPGQELMVADTPQQIAQNVLLLLDDQHLAESIAQAGLAFVRNNYHWESATEKLSAALTTLVDKKP